MISPLKFCNLLITVKPVKGENRETVVDPRMNHLGRAEQEAAREKLGFGDCTWNTMGGVPG